MPHDDPQNWRLEVPQDRIDLYLELSKSPRSLSLEEAHMMVELVDAWRGLEQKRNLALKAALSNRRDPPRHR